MLIQCAMDKMLWGVKAVIYSPTGRKIRSLDLLQQTGFVRSAVWDGRNKAGQSMPQGIYLIQVNAGGLRLRSIASLLTVD